MENIKSSLFDVMTVPLQDSNLIEASAGTGKTFSIAILALRILLQHFEKGKDKEPIYINQILMVTFTTAAVAELESRIRKYIRVAADYISASNETKESIKEEHSLIAEIVDKAVEQSKGYSEVQQTLKDNLLLLDEANIMTIHSFCQSTLNEFAIETNQLFGVELFTDTDKLLDNELNKFWRKYITTLDVAVLLDLDIEKKRKSIKEVVKFHLDGKVYAFFEEGKDYSTEDLNQRWYLLKEDFEREKEAIVQQIKDVLENSQLQTFIQKLNAKQPSKDKYIHAIADVNAFIEVYKNDSTSIKNKLPEELKNILDEFMTKYSNMDLCSQNYFVAINNLAIQEMSKGYVQYLSSNNYVTYDELIDKLHIAVNSASSSALIEKLNTKYKAVFVDEFQDTDKKQYQIFHRSFAEKSILFLIGDPKQSIYGWRKADMLTYFKARENVSRVYHMNINYRSSKVAIDAMNYFFKPNLSFDTFYFHNNKDKIDYTAVDVPENSTKDSLTYQGDVLDGMELWEAPNQSAIKENVVSFVYQLLTDDGYRINDKPVEPSNIGIVVRKNSQGAQIKLALAQLEIPSVVVNEEKVLNSDEAVDVLYLLLAVLSPSLSKINRFLMTNLVGFDYKKVLQVDDSRVLDIFQDLSSIWTKSGVYPMLIKFSAVFGMEAQWMYKAEGERILTNFFHITELLNQMEKKKNYSPEELIAWLQRSTEGLEHSGDEFELRMESDDNAVKIVTIHKSKGLEYDIVLAPFLDFGNAIPKEREFVQFYDQQKQQYITKEVLLLTDDEKDIYQIEQERENRRLIYVAITRAAYRFYVFKSTWEKDSGLTDFFNAFDSTIIHHSSSEEGKEELTYSRNDKENKSSILEASNFKLLDENWHKLSFTGLTAHGDGSLKERTKVFQNEYDAFVFDQLKFGAASGNLLHSLLEEIDFSSDYRRKEIIEKVLRQYLPSEEETILPSLEVFLDHILNVPIHVGDESIQLKNVPNYKRLAELEFDFPLKDFDYNKLLFDLKDYYPIRTRQFEKELIGLMNGKIDLFFEYDNKYYILDWKSNYLGYQLENYDEKGVVNAMNENNYHLQYFIYIVAAKKMLESRLSYFNYEKQFGGVIYLFLRGVRKDSNTGIFTVKPSYRIIKSIEDTISKTKTELV